MLLLIGQMVGIVEANLQLNTVTTHEDVVAIIIRIRFNPFIDLAKFSG
ncbi:Uncharacterised protein [Vibrio cholerae]|uniref:Uncharacterized protein n=1 Tax=Vibrio cholerae TaxID=666 RepID=A0A655WRY9_VIBCL|nr:Uncharacterised protein [Vibrio cholerae]